MRSVYHPAKTSLNIIWNMQTTTLLLKKDLLNKIQLHQIQLDWFKKKKAMEI